MNLNYSVFIKSLLIIIFYFFLGEISHSLAEFVGMSMLTVNVTLDLLFLSVILFIYRQFLIENIIEIKNNLKKMLLKGIKYFVIAFLLIMLTNALVRLFFPEMSANDVAIFQLPTWYMIIKVFVFSTIVEEIVLKKTVRDIVYNPIVFIVFSSILYATMNFVYSDLTTPLELLNILQYLIWGTVMSLLFVRTDNIVLNMGVKLLYNMFAVLVIAI